MKIVVLDAYHLNPGDLSWEPLEALGETHIYDATEPEQIIERAKNADIILSNKVVISAAVMAALPSLKCICVMATGYNNIDVEEASKRGIVVCNVAGYSTDSVAQHVFAGIFAVLNKIETYAEESRNGIWTSKNDWTYVNEPIINISGKTMGILGFGKIGSAVAKIALAFGMSVIAYHKYPERDKAEGVKFVDLNSLYAASDFLSLHVPLNDSTHHIINKESLKQFRMDAILINTGRGPLIDEAALAEALRQGGLRAAVLDVMENEPPKADNPLLPLGNCYITPHVAWAGKEARIQLMEILIGNVKGFISGDIQNSVI